MTMTMETMSISSNKSYREEQVHDTTTTTTTQYQSLYITMSSPSTRRATPDHWPIASPSIATAHFHPIVIAKDTTSSSYNSKQLHQATRRSPLQFFSINTLLHQQDEECWENNNNNDDDDSDDSSSSSSDSYYEQIMKMPQSQSSSSSGEHINLQRPYTPTTSPPPLVNTSQTKKEKKYVTFNSNNLISSIHYRPKTSTPDISKLYYTEIQIKQFKKEYKHDKRIEETQCIVHKIRW